MSTSRTAKDPLESPYRQSIDDPETFWAQQAHRIDWHAAPTRILDASDPEMPRWFVGGKTNLCHNAVDRHLPARAQQTALVHVCGESGVESSYTYARLHEEVNAMAVVLQSLGVKQGDRVMLYMPVMPETVFAMLACVRLGAIHTVVFGGFPADALARRIDAATPDVVVTAERGMRNGVDIDFRSLATEALAASSHRPAHLLLVEREHTHSPMRPWMDDVDDTMASAHGSTHQVHGYGALRAAALGKRVACAWLDSDAPSYILHTSGTTGHPKGIVRDTGGHAVALATSLERQFGLQAGDTLFSTSDLGWVVGHSYGVYAPLIGGMTTVLYEGSPIRPSPDVLWRLMARHRVNAMLSAPTVMRLLQRGGLALARHHDLSSLRTVFLAGEPLDEVSAHAIEQAIGVPVVDHYWQTETGSPIVAGALRVRHGGDDGDAEQTGSAIASTSAGRPVSGFRLEIVDEESGAPCAPGVRGIVALLAPLPPGCLRGLWGDSASGERLRGAYWSDFTRHGVYSTSDWGVCDADGGIRLLGRADDTLNVAGQRIGTREIEEAMRADPALADVAVVGIADPLRGQIPVAFAILSPDRDAHALDEQGAPLSEAQWREQLTVRLGARVKAALGKGARPRRIFFVTGFPRTRSGKVMRRLIQDVFAGKPCAELQMVDDVAPLSALSALRDIGTRLTCSAEASDADTAVPNDSPSEISA